MKIFARLGLSAFTIAAADANWRLSLRRHRQPEISIENTNDNEYDYSKMITLLVNLNKTHCLAKQLRSRESAVAVRRSNERA